MSPSFSHRALLELASEVEVPIPVCVTAASGCCAPPETARRQDFCKGARLAGARGRGRRLRQVASATRVACVLLAAQRHRGLEGRLDGHRLADGASEKQRAEEDVLRTPHRVEDRKDFDKRTQAPILSV